MKDESVSMYSCHLSKSNGGGNSEPSVEETYHLALRKAHWAIVSPPGWSE